ncbi:MAG: superoxide dismutase, Ni [Chloroflexi bacterium]|nr:superoxide dismutase, Ni [Chloroflexota bacterium]
MNLGDRALAAFERIFPAEEASAHCDIPCAIYDPHAAQVAALTVIRMYQLMKDLPDPGNDAESRAKYVNSMTRYVTVKEEHAQLCKEQVLILWTDYFKPEHLEKFPELHDTVWQTTKLCSKVKQTIDMQAAQQLLDSVNRIAEWFWQSKGQQTRRQPSMQQAGGEFVSPVAQ